MKKKITALLTVLMFLFSMNSGSFASAGIVKKAPAIKIVSVSNISRTIMQNAKFELPKTVAAKLSNGKSSNVTVKWNKSSVNTSVAGTFQFTGKIAGYAKNVKLTLLIKPLPVVKAPQIQSVREFDPATVNQNEPFALPDKVTVELDNNTTAEVDIVWSGTAKTDKPGEFSFTGTVKDYSKEVSFKLVVKPIIKALVNPAAMEAKENVSKTLPTTVVAEMTDGTKTDAAVKWNKTADELKRGMNTLEGTVEGFGPKAVLKFVVRGQDLGAPEQIQGQEAKPGDIVGVKSSFNAGGVSYPYEHYGIYIGNGQVIEFASATGKMEDAKITQNPMSKSFSSYFILKLKDSDIKYTGDAAVEKAKSKLGEGNYDLIGYNCEHFAVWCQTGVYKSFQSDKYPLSFIETAESLLQLIKLSY